MTKPSIPAVSDADAPEAGAPEDELELIELTDEMRDAGITREMAWVGELALMRHDRRFETPGEAAVRIFLTMIEASGEGHHYLVWVLAERESVFGKSQPTTDELQADGTS